MKLELADRLEREGGWVFTETTLTTIIERLHVTKGLDTSDILEMTDLVLEVLYKAKLLKGVK